jgi:hypothetical protein
MVNPSKSQAMIVNPAGRPIYQTLGLRMGGSSIAFSRKVKNLGLVMNSEFTWDDQVSKVCRNVLFTLKHLWTMSQFTPLKMRHKLVTALIIPQCLYCDVIFLKSTARLRERLKIAFNSCARYIYGISHFEHISHYSNQILGVPLDLYYNYRICCTMNTIIKSGCPRYLYSELQFGQSSRCFNLNPHIGWTGAHHRSLFKAQCCGMAYHQRSRERGASGSLGKSVCQVCADR